MSQNRISRLVLFVLIGGLLVTIAPRALDRCRICRGTGPSRRVRNELAELDKAIALFELDRGRAPLHLLELLMPSEDFPEGLLSPGAFPVDPWKRPYRYRPLPDGGYLLRCDGPDGVPDTGDDLVRR